MAYTYAFSITIDHTKCGSAGSSNFPLFFAGASTLATTANGGQTSSSSGFDINFFSDAGLTTKLNWEMVSFNAATGAGEWHIQVPTLSASADTVIYGATGNASITTDQSSHAAVWDSNFKAVYHLGTSSSLVLSDSTGSGNTGTSIGSPAAASGKVGGGVSLNGSSSISIPTLSPTGALTLSGWAYPTAVASENFLIGKGVGPQGVCGSPYTDFGLNIGNGSAQFDFEILTGGARTQVLGAANAAVNGNWYHVCGVYDGSSTARLYVNGALVASSSVSGSRGSSSYLVYLGDQGGCSSMFHGTLDELRISSTNRSASWITAEYNNQSAPTSFYTLAAATLPSTATGNALMFL